MAMFDCLLLLGVIYFSICVASFLKLNLSGLPKFLNLIVSIVSPFLLAMFIMKFLKKFFKEEKIENLVSKLTIFFEVIKLTPLFHTLLTRVIESILIAGVQATEDSDDIKEFNGNIEMILKSTF